MLERDHNELQMFFSPPTYIYIYLSIGQKEQVHVEAFLCKVKLTNCLKYMQTSGGYVYSYWPEAHFEPLVVLLDRDKIAGPVFNL